MIYVSTSCVRHNRIADSIRELAAAGYRCIELSGGTSAYPRLETDIEALKDEFGLSYLVHNYFPPPQHPFVLNLASMDHAALNASVDHCMRAIELSKRIGSDRFSVHAGFFIDMSINEIGSLIDYKKMEDQDASIERFCCAYEKLKSFADDSVKLYIENNVLSAANYRMYRGSNPLMFTDRESYKLLRSKLDFNFLMDIGHLKVSCQTLGLNFEEELNWFIANTDYLHISDNDGRSDANDPFSVNHSLARLLKKMQLTGKTITVEVHGLAPQINQSFKAVERLIYV